MSSVNHTSTPTLQAIHHQLSNEIEEELQEGWRGRSVTSTKNLKSQHLLLRETIPSEKVEPADSKTSKSLKRPRSEVIDLTQPDTNPLPRRAAKRKREEMQMVFVHGTDDHIDKYAKCIDEAESHIIIASWNLNFIPQKIFSSLMRAKRREVSISLVVQSVKREETLNYFYEDEEGSSDYTFDLFETKSHAKFLFVDSKALILGSYNALGDSYEESFDASVVLKGTVKALWPFYMSIRETYTSIGEDLSSIFGGIAMISKFLNPGPRQLLQRSFEDSSRIFLLRTVREHEEFFRLATPCNGDVSIYSPFSTKDNTFKRLQALDRILPSALKVSLKVLPRFKRGLTRLLAKVPDLQSRVSVEVTSSHQKVVILGTETICVGSLNWLSAAQDQKVSYCNAELSIVLQGPKARDIIKSCYSI